MFSIKIIESGSFMADGGAMFGTIPKRAWKRKYPETGDNLCKLSMRCLLAISDTKKILIDLGMGNKYPDKVSYYQPFDLKNIPEELLTHGIKPGDITDVIITHLHFDHCGYATHWNKEGAVVPTFPKAKYWLSKAQWDNFREGANILEADSIFSENILPIWKAHQLHLIEKDTCLYQGLELRLFNGHSIGQLLPLISTNEGIVAYPGDLVPTAAHVSLEWISAYDLCAQTSVLEKLRFLTEAEAKQYTLIYYHDAYTISSRVKKLNDNFGVSALL